MTSSNPRHASVKGAWRGKSRCLILTTALFFNLLPGHALSRDFIQIVGSSTVFPFTATAAEEFGQKTPYRTPVVERLGTGGGLKLFCNGLGTTRPFDYPDIANASRRIKASEVALCRRNGITNIVEIKIGYDGIVLANSKLGPRFSLSARHLYLALAKYVPAPSGSKGHFISNPYTHWNQIDPSLPDQPIEVIGPPPTSGTRDAFNELAIEAGCRTFPKLRDLIDEDRARNIRMCQALREDGRFVEAGENDNLIVQKLEANPRALGVFGFSFMEQNADILSAASVNGITPSFEAISSGQYPIARSMFLYVKAAHMKTIPGLSAFVMEMLSDAAMGEYGYLVDKGLIPLPEKERLDVQSFAAAALRFDLDTQDAKQP